MGVLSFIVITAVNLNLNKNIVNYVDKEHEKETNDIKQELAQELEKNNLSRIYVCQKKLIILLLRKINHLLKTLVDLLEVKN